MSAPAPAAEPAATRQNPFVGPRAYGRDDRLYGRDGETEDLLDLLVAERVVLLHSPSGAGKTSLVQARLVPRLEEDGFRVRPIVRTTHEVPAILQEGTPPNRYVLSTLLSLEEGLPAAAQRPVAELAGLTIPRYLAEASRPEGAPENAVLVFDQFEEVLTTSPADRAAKVEFFTQVGAALRDRSLWALFVIREDFLAELAPYARLVPTRFANRYRLDLLEVPAALDAVTLSARDSGVTFDPDAAVKLVDDLRRIRVQHLGTVTEEHGPYVEPVQLQVVCRQLWERLGPGTRSIEESDVASVGDVNQALATYYAASLEATAARAGADESLVRDWVDRELITAQGFRAQTLYGPHHDPGLDDAVLRALIDTHLLRSESRRGAVWYELAHDRLVEPIQKDNARWRGEHLSELEQRAALWDEQGRGDDLLVTGPALAEAEAALRRTGRTPSGRVHDFLETSRRRQRDAERMERAQRRTKRWLIVALAGCAAALVALVVAIGFYLYADAQRGRAELAGLVGRAVSVAGRNPDLGLALAVHAADLWGDAGVDEQAQDQIQSMLDTNRVLLPLPADGPNPRAVDVSDDGRFMAAADEDGTVHVWDRAGRLVRTLAAGAGSWSVSFGPPGGADGPAIAAGSVDRVTVWSSPADTAPTVIPSATPVYAVELSPNGRQVVSGAQGGTVLVSDAETGAEITRMRRPGGTDTNWVVDAGWTPDGSRIAATDSDGHLALWDPAAPATPVWDVQAHSFGNALAVSADGRMIATAGDREVALWDAGTGANLRHVATYSGYAWDVDLSADGTRMLVADYNGYLLPIDPRTGAALYTNPDYGPRRVAARLDPTDPNRALVVSVDSPAAVVDVSAGHAQSPVALDAAPDGTMVTGAPDSGTLRLWSPGGQLSGTLDTGPAGITDTALSADGRFVAVLDNTTHVSVHRLQGGGDPVVLPAKGVTAVAISPDGRFVATADGSYAVTVTDTTGTVAPRVLTTSHTATVTGLSFGPSADAVAAAHDDGTATWWTGGGARITVQLGGRPQSEPPYKVVWSPDGDVIATAGRGNVPELWDARTGRRLFQLKQHTQQVNDIAFDRSGGRLATVSDDRDVVVWDVATGKPVQRRTFSSWGNEVEFSPDDKRVYIVGLRGGVYVGYLDRTDLLTVARSHLTRGVSADECERYVGSAGSCAGT